MLVSFGCKMQSAQKQGSSKESDSHQPSKKDKPNNYETFLEEFYSVIFKLLWSADVYKENYRQKAINTALFQKAQKRF